MSSTNTTETILWGSLADGSWGGCHKDELVVIPANAVSDEEWTELGEASDSGVIELLGQLATR